MPETLNLTERPTVLVVDDSPDNLALLSTLLKERYKVKVANNGERALKIVQGDTPPSLVLLDIMMPGLSGYEVCERLKADPHTRPVPVVFLSGMTDSEDRAKGLQLGAADFIAKPVDPAVLMHSVAKHLQASTPRPSPSGQVA